MALSNATTALFLLVNANVECAQRIFFLAAAAPSEQGIFSRSSLDDLVEPEKYKAVAAVIRQCDQPKLRPINCLLDKIPKTALSRLRPLMLRNPNVFCRVKPTSLEK